MEIDQVAGGQGQSFVEVHVDAVELADEILAVAAALLELPDDLPQSRHMLRRGPLRPPGGPHPPSSHLSHLQQGPIPGRDRISTPPSGDL